MFAGSACGENSQAGRSERASLGDPCSALLDRCRPYRTSDRKGELCGSFDDVRREYEAGEVWAGVKATNLARVAVVEYLVFALLESLPTHQPYRLRLA